MYILLPCSLSDLDMLTCHSAPIVGCRNRKDRPLSPCRDGFLSFGPAHRKLSRSSKGSRDRTRGRRA